MKIPFLEFGPAHDSIRSEVVQTFTDFYDSKWYVLGEQLSKFEREYAAFSRVKYAVGTSNGLDALFLALKSLDIKESDEVIMPSNTFIATVLAVSFVGATPIFVEPDPDTCLLDPLKIQQAITAKTKAIIPVHLYGQACQMDQIMAIATENRLFVVEDNAQAHGATFANRMTGSFGAINATSFYPGKNLGALGDAGALTTDDESLQLKASMLRNYGSGQKYHHSYIGHNMRLDELQAAFLSVKLKSLAHWTSQRRQISQLYSEYLSDIEHLKLPWTHPDATHVFHLYVVRSEKRDQLQQYLTDKGIGTLIHYPIPPHLQEAYRHLGYKVGDFPIAERLAKTSLSLPIWPGMTPSQGAYVVEQIRSFFQKL